MYLNMLFDVLTSESRMDDTALICDDVILTYQALNDRIGGTMLLLREHGLHNAQMISICMERSIECVVVAIALLKYKIPFVLIPIDTPEERKRYIQSNSCSDYLIELENKRYKISKLHNAVVFPFRNTAFLIYTSGSTGKPKGVSINRDSLCYFFQCAPEALHYRDNTHIHLASTSFSFDLHVLDLFLPLILGKTVVLTTETETKNARLMGGLLRKYRVDTILATPTKLLWLMNGNKDTSFFNHLRTLVLAGENIRPALLTKLQSLYKGQVYNAYGPTEATVFVTSTLINSSRISAGQSLPGDEIVVLDENLEQLSDGSEGEICIAGPSLADGYVGDPEQTAQRFRIIEGKRYYLTGDIGKVVNGELHILGRRDRQIKMNGYRIELDEIESVIYATNIIKDCAISYNMKRNAIVAFYEADGEISRDIWYKILEIDLPQYMIPKIYIRVSQISRNSSGKINRYYYENYFEENN